MYTLPVENTRPHLLHCATSQGVKKPPKPTEVTQAERDFRRKSWMWLIGAGVVTFGYILFSGRYIEVGGPWVCKCASPDHE
jgi:hypothetical protein